MTMNSTAANRVPQVIFILAFPLFVVVRLFQSRGWMALVTLGVHVVSFS